MTVATTGIPVSQQLVRKVMKTLRDSRKNRVIVQAWPSATEIAMIAFLEARDWHKAQKRRFIFSVDGACFGRKGRSVYGYSHSR